jgi:hypothetical protein
MNRYLVMVDFPEPHQPPIAGIYVMAETKHEAIRQVKAILEAASFTAYLRSKT